MPPDRVELLDLWEPHILVAMLVIVLAIAAVGLVIAAVDARPRRRQPPPPPPRDLPIFPPF